jgi:hypothetical protein
MAKKTFPRGEGSRIQSLVFDKQYYDVSHAKRKARAMGMTANKVDVDTNTIRVRQNDPSQYKTFRMKQLTPTIQAVIGIKHPKASSKSKAKSSK